MTEPKKIDREETIIEVICGACFPYVCADWELKPAERPEKCKQLREWLSQILALIPDKEGWELQDTLLNLTVLNQNAPKIVLTNDECGWSITYYPNPPYTTGKISIMKGNPLEVVRALKLALKEGSTKEEK